MPVERTPQLKSSCIACDQPDTNKMVQCDLCAGWIHFDCAHVEESIGDTNRGFICDKCLSQSAHGTTPTTVSPSMPVNVPATVPLTVTPVSVASTEFRNPLPHYQEEEDENVQLLKRHYEKKLKHSEAIQASQGKELYEVRKKLRELTEQQKETEFEKRQLEFQLKRTQDNGIGQTLQNLNLSVPSSMPIMSTVSNVVPTFASTPLSNWPPGRQIRAPMPSHTLFSTPANPNDYYRSPMVSTASHPNERFATSNSQVNFRASSLSQMVSQLTPQQIAARKTMKIDLPTFDGQPEQWPLFISTVS